MEALDGWPGLRVILHLDNDAFYAAVEAKRLKVDAMLTPLGVRQWDGLIAVSYGARPFGVKRGDRTCEALRKCPQIQLADVEYISNVDVADQPPTRESCKVSLRRYREASRMVMSAVLASCGEEACVERASIDEAYVDVSRSAARAYCSSEDEDAEVLREWRSTEGIPKQLLQKTTEPTLLSPDQLLAGGALIAARIRVHVRRATGYTMSAGIANCKMVAKLGSSRFKPNRQTAIIPSAVQVLLDPLLLAEINGLRGKHGAQILAALQLGEGATVEQVRGLERAEVVARVGAESAHLLLRVCCGQDDSKVRPNLQPKSLNCHKSGNMTTEAELSSWLMLLAKELCERLEEDYELNHRSCTTLTLGCRGALKQTHKEDWVAGRTSQLTGMPTRSMQFRVTGQIGLDRIALAAKQLLAKHKSTLPCTRLQLSASGFVEHAGRSVLGFFKAADSGQERPQQPSATLDTSPVCELVEQLVPDARVARYICDTCRDTFENEKELQSHQDMHIAQRLQSQWRREDLAEHRKAKKSKPRGIMDFFTQPKRTKHT